MIGSTLNGRYVITRKIADGGMATVFRGIDIDSEVEVAIKHFPKATDISRLELASFRKELESLSRLQHPNIIRLLGHGADDKGHPYLVLELLDHDLSAHRELESATAFDGYDDFFEQIGSPILNALAYAHSIHITHRDVKPRNILVAKGGIVKLADFGIARLKGYLSGMRTLRDFETKPFGPPEPDDGAFSDARDVFAFGALTVWALSEQALTDYQQLYDALSIVDVHPTVKSILAKCLSKDPAVRFENAIVLQCAIDEFLRSRRKNRSASAKSLVRVKLDSNTIRKAEQLLELGNTELEAALSEDISDEPTIGFWVTQGKQVQTEFAVIGSQFQYHLLFKDQGQPFFVIGLEQPPLALLQHRRTYHAACPVRLSFKSLGSYADAITALDQIVSAIVEKEAEKPAEQIHPLIEKWANVLSAKRAIEQQRTPTVRYSEGRVLQKRVFAVLESTDGIEPGSRWTVKSGSYFVALEVSHFNGNEVVFYWRSSSEQYEIPKRGEFAFDRKANDVCLDRQEDALGRLRKGLATNPRLLAVLSNPERASAPQSLQDLSAFDQAVEKLSLDSAQVEATRASLGSDDVLIVHGPPGTGKTRLIASLVALIKQLATPVESTASILIASQTHVAIDNALEEIALINPSLRLLRISSTGDVSSSVQAYLLENQSLNWEKQVRIDSERWIIGYAAANDVDVEDVRKGCVLWEFLGVKQRLREVSDELGRLSEESSNSESIEATPSEIAESRERLRALSAAKKNLEKAQEGLVGKVAALVSAADAEVCEWSEDQICSLAEVLTGASAEHSRVKCFLDLRSDWLLRFGKGRAFNAAILARSDVVAGTCIGFMGLEDIGEVEFDWCIIDEASKASVLETLVPMVRAKKCILVGDTKQLPPFDDFGNDEEGVLQEFKICKDDLSISLFAELEQSLPEQNQRILTFQYRMCRPISKLVIDCFYQGKLRLGERAPDEGLLAIFGAPLVWFDTSGIQNNTEQECGTSFSNDGEVELILRHLRRLFDRWDFAGNRESILILSPYVAQVTNLRNAMSIRLSSSEVGCIECATIDAVQGRQAKVVIFSLTRSTPNRFVDDLPRVNVALSRAKDLLLIVGNEQATRESGKCKNLQKVLEYFDRNPSDCKYTRYLLGEAL